MINKPNVSVVISAYNHENFISESINSVLNQTYKDYEIIIINDGSSDSTAKIIKEQIDHISEPKITFIDHKENQRPKFSGNQGISLAKGNYIAWNDGDDIWYPSKLEKQMEIFENDNSEAVGIIYTFGENININPDRYRKNILEIHPEPDVFKQLFNGAFFFKVSMVVRKTVYENIGVLNEKYPYCGDYHFMLRAAAGGYKFKCIPEILVGHRIHDSNETKDRAIANKNTREMLFEISERYKDLIISKNIDVAKRLGVCDLQSAQHHFIQGQMYQCRKLMFKIIKSHWQLIVYKKRYLAYFVLSCFPKKLSEVLRGIKPFNKLFLAS